MLPATRKESLPMGKHAHPDNVRRRRGAPAAYTPVPTSRPAPEPLAEEPDTLTRRVAPWVAGALVAGAVVSGAAAAPSPTLPISVSRLADLPNRPPVTQEAAAATLADLAASRSARQAETAASAQIQADAEASAQEAQDAAAKATEAPVPPLASEAVQEPPRPPADPTENAPAAAPGTAAEIAVQTALDQLGKPYVWGAEGPGSFDCSGLVLFTYQAAGISLPRVSSAQALAGVRVTRDELQPGDLVAFYSPVSHIGIYIGDGQMVHAPEPGDVVKVTSIDVMGYIAAFRRVA